MRKLLLSAMIFAAPLNVFASTLVANCSFTQSIAAEVPLNGDIAIFKRGENILSLTISDEELEDNRGLLVGNNGTANLYLTAGPFGISYSEGIHGGTVSAVTIYMNTSMPSGNYVASMVRTFNVAPPGSPKGSALPSLWVGRCQVELG